MKKNLLYFAFVAAMLAGIVFCFKLANSRSMEAQLKLKGDGPNNPGWEDQFFTMKKNTEGIIPVDLIQQLREQQQAEREERSRNKRPMGNLLNVMQQGPDNVGGRTRAFMVDHSDENHLIAGGVSGGIWRSVNKGQSWEPVNDFAATLSVSDISQNPFDANIIYYSTGEVSGNSAGITGNGVYKSTDKGLTFNKLASTSGLAFTRTYRIKCSLTDSSTVYVASDIDGLYKSEDGGLTFSKVFTLGLFGVSDLEVFEDGSVLIAIEGKGIYRSVSGAQGTFIKQTIGLPTGGFKRIELAYSPSNPQIMYAAMESSSGAHLLGMYKTINGGEDWFTLANPGASGTSAFKFAWYCLTLAVKPDNPNLVVAGSVEFKYSTDGGSSWLTGYNSHADYHTLVFNPFNYNELFVGNDGGVYRYNSLALTSTPLNLNNGYNVTQFYSGTNFPYGNSVMGGTQDNGTQMSPGGNMSFVKVLGADGGYCHIHPQDPDVAYASWQNGHLQRTDNINSTFPYFASVLNELDANYDNSVDDGAWFIHPFEINPVNGSHIYYPTKKRLWRSLDSGDSWQPITGNLASGTSNSSLYSVAVSPSSNPTVYVAGGQGLFFRIDNAASASPVVTALPNSVVGFSSNIQIHPLYDSVVYIASSNYNPQGRLYKVYDAKSAAPVFVDIAGDLPQGLPVNWVEVSHHNDQVLVAGTDMGLYTSVNGGQNWMQELTVPNVPVFMMSQRESDNKLYVFTHGRGVWTATMPVLPVSSPSAIKTETYKIAPNPTSGRFAIKGDFDKAELYAATGQRVVLHFIRSGRELDISSLRSGTYVVKLYKSGSVVHSGKVVKL